MLIEYHRTMLADRTRNDAFHRALQKAGVAGKTVADIGCGTGFLGFLASNLGAREVHMFESASIIAVAQKLAKANGIKNCRFHAGHSTQIDIPPVDVVISETFGNYAFEENIASTLNDAKRFLKKGGTVIPHGVAQYACPVVSEKYHAELCVWDDAGFGLDFAPAKAMSLNNAYVRAFKPADLLGNGARAEKWDEAAFDGKTASARKGGAAWRFKKNETVFGLALWWTATLVPGVTLSTAPDAPKTHWDQLFLPFEKPVRGKKGDVLSAAIETRSSFDRGTDMRWRCAVNGKNPQGMDLRKGYLA